jgi:uncharacterized protein with GYD domain
MPLYVVRLTHPPDQCPLSNTKVRQMMTKGAPEMPKMAKKMGIKFIAGPLVIGAEHDGLAVVEANQLETVQDFVLQSGLSQWNSVKVSQALPLDEALKELDKAPPPLY